MQVKRRELSKKIRVLSNESVTKERTIEHFERCLQIEPEADKKIVVEVYEAAQVEVSDMVKKTLEEVEEFHNTILSNRNIILAEEFIKKKNELTELKIRKADLMQLEEAAEKAEDEWWMNYDCGTPSEDMTEEINRGFELSIKDPEGFKASLVEVELGKY
jgi:uncharacterized protein YydD (DUF2326 family)